MAGIRPYILFGWTGAPAGGMGDYRSAWFSADEAKAEASRLGLATWQVAVNQDEALQLVAASSDTPAAEALPAEALPGGVSGG